MMEIDFLPRHLTIVGGGYVGLEFGQMYRRFGSEVTILRISKLGEDVIVSLSCAAGAPEVNGSHLLLAVGRRPNTGDLGLEKAGVETDSRGYIVQRFRNRRGESSRSRPAQGRRSHHGLKRLHRSSPRAGRHDRCSGAPVWPARVGRAVEKGESQGFMKIVVEADTREILGAAIFGTGGDEALHRILDVMYSRRPIRFSNARCTFIPPFPS